MNFKQSFTLAIKSLTASKMRSFLTMLGIIIGVASVIILVSLVDGLKNKITGQFEELGTNLIQVIVMGRDSSRTASTENFEKLVEKNPKSLGLVTPYISMQKSTAKYENENIKTSVTGISDTYKEIRRIETTQGRFIEYTDVVKRQKVCVIGSYVAKKFFGDIDPLNKSIKINNEYFKIIGIVEEKAGSREGGEDDVIFIPYTIAERYTKPSIYFFSALNEDTVDRGMHEIKTYLMNIFQDEKKFTIVSQDQMMDMVNEMTGTMTLVLVGVAAISLLVGGIGIMNIMLVSVTERTREIGIRKSLGAKKRDIMSQFVVEAATTSAMGGVIGIVFGAGVSILFGKLLDMEVYPSLNAILIAFSVSAIIGIAFGYMPANRAAKLNPIEALRHD